MKELAILKISGSMAGNNGSYVPLNEYVELQERFDKLRSERDALAAENATLKELATGYADRADQLLSDLTGNCESDNRRECFEECNKTPATDAYLNSVRAEGALACGIHLREWYDYQVEERAEDFAAQLRAGEPS